MHIDREIQRERKWRNIGRGREPRKIERGEERGREREKREKEEQRGEIFEAGSGDRFKLIEI
jgi:hypothetical protein